MFYDFVLTVPANTAVADPAEKRMKLTAGIIHRVEIDYPIGTRALVHVKVLRGGHQLFPTNPSGDIATDGHVVAWDEHEELSPGDTELVAYGWSTANTYSYDIAIRLGILPKAVIYPLTGLTGSLKKLVSFLGGR